MSPSPELDGERTAVPLAARWLPRLSTGRKIALLGAAGVVVVIYMLWQSPPKRKDEQPEQVSRAIGAMIQPPPIPAEPIPTAPAPAHAAPAVIRPTPATLPPPRTDLRQVLPGPMQPAEKSPPGEVFYGSREQAPGPSASSHAAPTGTTVAFKSATLPGAKAGRALDRSLIMMPQLIPCVLDNAIDSTLPGPIQCHTPQDVLSPAGVVLMERGTLITGEYKNNLQTGQTRIFTLAATAYTPNGVPVPLDGPVADGLGRAGTAGSVDSHLFERFGGAVMLALTGSALQIIQSALSHGDNQTFNFGSGADTSAINQVATEVLRSSINIPPTITVPQGSEIGVWVTYPIDFSDVYELRTTR